MAAMEELMSLRISKDLKQAVKQKAEKAGVSMNTVTLRALQAYLKQ